MSINYIILGITAIVSYSAFNNNALLQRLIFNAYQVQHRKEWWRLLSHGFIHGDMMHLIFNMLALWMFGGMVENYFNHYFQEMGMPYYLLLYLGGIVVATLYSLEKHKNNPSYNALGASGAVSAVVFASILMNPNQQIGVFIIPPIIPGWIFGGLYLWYSGYMSKKGMDNVGHDAHLWGAVYGFLLTIALRPAFLQEFFDQIINQ